MTGNVWRGIRRGLVALFVCVHLGALVAYNILQLVPGEFAPAVIGPAAAYMKAAGIHQRWNMFAPQVSDHAGAPVLVLVFADGRMEFVHPPSTPRLVHDVPNQLRIHELPPEQRVCHWSFHIVDGRMRKLESYTTRSGPQFIPIRSAWTRWMLTRWLAENPGRGRELAFVQFARADVVYDGDGPLPRIDRVVPMLVEPVDWPVPARPLPGVLP